MTKRNSPASRTRERGLMLLEVMIVVAIFAMIAAAVGIGVFGADTTAREHLTKTNARTIRSAVKTWWIDNDRNECPTVEVLVRAGALDRDGTGQDSWGQNFRVECAEGDVTVSSNGADRKLGTADDIRIPPT
jgi:hypothetical protein